MRPQSYTLGHSLLFGCLILAAQKVQQITGSALGNNAMQDDAPPETWFRVTGLTVVSVHGTRAEVKWVESTGPVVGYELRVCTKWMPRECQKRDLTEVGQKLQNLKPNTTYEVRVRPFDDTKPQRHYGDQVVVEFTTRPFPIVHDLKATARGSRSIQVEWEAPHEEVNGYTVHAYSKEAGFVQVDTNETFVILTNLSPVQTYTIEVKVVKKEGDKLSTGVPVLVSATTTALGAPTNVLLQATCDHHILASWDYAGDPPTGFELKLCEEGQQSCDHRTASPEQRNFDFKIAPRETTFTFTIQTSVHHTSGHLSEAVVHNIRSLKQAPKIEDFSVHPVTNKSLEVSWKAIQEGRIGIEVCPATKPKSQCVNHITDSGDSKYWIHGLKEGAQYTVSASFKHTAEGPVCLYKQTSLSVTIPAEAPGHNSASLSGLMGLLLVMSMLFQILR
ncbi:fibronectin-like [Amblyomma americanum]